MGLWRCYNPTCPGGRHPAAQYQFEADSPKCPECGAGEGVVVPMVPVHFLAPHDAGPFADCVTGMRRHVACTPERDHLATDPRAGGEWFSASEDPGATTCPACRRDVRWLAMAKALESMRFGFRIADGGCCGG